MLQPTDTGPQLYESEKLPLIVGKIWERTLNLRITDKSHRINGPNVPVRSHNPKVVSSNLTPATMGA